MSKNEDSVTIEVSVKFSYQEMVDILTTAFEGGITYWTRTGEIFYHEAELDDSGNWYANPELFSAPFLIRLWDVETEEEYFLSRESFISAFRRIPLSVLKNFVTQDYDADDADILIQTAIFGEVIFG